MKIFLFSISRIVQSLNSSKKDGRNNYSRTITRTQRKQTETNFNMDLFI